MLTAQSLRDGLTAAAGRLTETAERLGDSSWTWRPRADRWSPAEVVEHVVLVNRLGSRRLATLKPRSEPTAVEDREIPFLFYQGDEPIGLADPTGQFSDRAEALEALNKAAADLIGAVDPAADLRQLAAPHPLFGLLDGAQWVMFYAAHMDRHRAELIGLGRGHAAA